MANCFSVIWRGCLWTNDKIHNDILMKRIFIKLFQGLLALLGIAVATSCDGILGGMVCAYGTPTMDYTVQGKVVNADKEALKGIKVKPLRSDINGGIDSTYTDGSGNFIIAQKRTVGFGEAVSLVIEDEAGIYRTDTVNVKLVKVKDGDNKWYNGAYEAKDAVITMKEK